MARVSQHTIKYRHIIETIRKDLNLPEIRITWMSRVKSDGRAWGWEYKIEISPFLSIRRTIEVLMHEMRNVWQYHTNKLQNNTRSSKVWEGKPHAYVTPRQNMQKYLDLPWEKDARQYSYQIDRLFPGDLNAYLNTGKKASKNPTLDKKVSCVVYFASGKVNYVQTVRSAYEMGIDPNSLKDLDRVKLRNAINNVKAKGII